MADLPHVILFEGHIHPPLFRKTEKEAKPRPVEYETLDGRVAYVIGEDSQEWSQK